MPLATVNFKADFKLALVFAFSSLVYSFLALLQTQSRITISDYSPPSLPFEVGGHILFGVVAALPLLDLDLILLGGAMSILIDADHTPVALGLPVSGNPSHSVAFAMLSGLVLLAVSKTLFKKESLPPRKQIGLALIGIVVLLAHVSYDVYSGWYYFQPFIPLSFVVIKLEISNWIILELAAVFTALAGYLSARVFSLSNN